MAKDQQTVGSWIKPPISASNKQEIIKTGIEDRTKSELSESVSKKRELDQIALDRQNSIKNRLVEGRRKIDLETDLSKNILNLGIGGEASSIFTPTDSSILIGRDPKALSTFYTQTYKDLAKTLEVDNVKSLLKGDEGKKVATSELKDVQPLFDYLPKKEREAAEKKLKE
ncbi:hypothetical protein [Leptospira meyeri]|uniref:hypothetical protein n=1 Tax=Leptospira meyeri TaxID=29508 RepID=UPI0002C022BC|nr:hypothetical protein [Leptospira meyeri]EMJ90303.1 hypothetical protein LEP1GSC196_0190 [Leptospira meyeri serovar Semaranga str. Veldrot Semarang 173]